jgi:hypothetical protein
MKLTPVTGPGAVQDLSTPDSVRTAKAVAAFNKGASSYDKPQAQEHPVANPNAVSVEELSAIQPPTKTPLEAFNEAKNKPESDSNANTESEVTAEVKDPEVERRFAQIARQERALRAKIQQANLQLKQREEALKAKEAAIQQPAAPDLSQYIPRERLKQDALTVLEEEGVSWDALANRAMNRVPVDPMVTSTIQKLEAKIASLEKANETSQQTYQQQQKNQYEAAIKQIRSDVKQLVYTDPEFETVKAMNATKDVVELIERVYAKDGIVLSVEDAAKEVENYLVEEAMKVTQLDKIKKRMAASNASNLKSEVKTQTKEQPQTTKTLTNATASARKVSARERAIARANGFTGDF